MRVYRFVYSIPKYGAKRCEGVVSCHKEHYDTPEKIFDLLSAFLINWLGATHPLNTRDIKLLEIHPLGKPPKWGYIDVPDTGKAVFK